MNMNTFCSANWKKRSWNESNYAAESDLDPGDQGPVAVHQAALRGPAGILIAGHHRGTVWCWKLVPRLCALSCFGSELLLTDSSPLLACTTAQVSSCLSAFIKDFMGS